ncbi:MAG: hypothetical protein WC668_01440 [Patescibacteria group bacterium]|jgi:hypothetical protein
MEQDKAENKKPEPLKVKTLIVVYDCTLPGQEAWAIKQMDLLSNALAVKSEAITLITDQETNNHPPFTQLKRIVVYR